MKTSIHLLLGLLAVSFFFSSCNKSEDNGEASVEFRLTDAPGRFDAVYVDIQGIEIIAGGQTQTITPARPGIYNLLDFSNGIDTLLGNANVSPGRLNQIRLLLGSNNSVVVDSVSFPLATPSAQQSGLKLNVQYELEAGISYQFVLDFDAGRSIVLQGNGSYLLKPVIRVFTRTNQGAIRGDVNPDSLATYAMAISGTDTFGTIPAVDGKFLIGGLAPGNYAVVVQGSQSGQQSTLQATVTAGQVTDLGVIQW